ncbi:MAG: HNH endonuclease [bacterium]|nr:HNH endonuclease [bacterium]
MCRSFTVYQARKIVEEHGAVCYWCKAPLQTVVIDHFVPFIRDGKTTIENGVPSCVRCNQDKGDMMPDDYLEKIVQRNATGRSLDDLEVPAEHQSVKPVYKKIAPKLLSTVDYEKKVLEEKMATIRGGLLQLDPENDDHWNYRGWPRWEAMYKMLGFRPNTDQMRHAFNPNNTCIFCGKREGSTMPCRSCPQGYDGAIPGFDRPMAAKIRKVQSAVDEELTKEPSLILMVEDEPIDEKPVRLRGKELRNEIRQLASTGLTNEECAEATGAMIHAVRYVLGERRGRCII